MRGGKDEKKLIDPLFPRLHINDTERGGPRAPPRNKMALCEEINSPSQRPSSGSILMRPLQPNNSTSSASLNTVGCHKKSGMFSFCNMPGSSRMGERFYPDSLGVMGFDIKSINPEYRISKSANSQTFYARGPLKVTAERKLFRPFGFYTSLKSSAKKLEHENDLRIPYFPQTEKRPCCNGIRAELEKKKLTASIFSNPGKYQTVSERLEEQTRSNDLMSRNYMRNQVDLNSKMSQIREANAESPPPLLSAGKKILADGAPNPLAKNITSDSGTRPLIPTHQTRTSSLVNDFSRSTDPCTESRQECRTLAENTASIYGISRNPERHSRKRSFSTMEGPSCSSPPPGKNNKIPNLLETVNDCPKDDDIASSQVEDAKRAIDISDNSVVDSKSGIHISPDDVVGAIGPKIFWKVRRTIVHQQRIFAAQLFELHRLIKVQKMIAGSPEMLYEDKLRCSKPSMNCSPVKKLLSQKVSEPPVLFVKPKCASSQKSTMSSDCAAQDVNVKLPPLKSDSDKGLIIQKSTPELHSGALTSGSFASDAKLAPLCFHAATINQWLVPVRSPSEGLVYKPYRGPYCPPTTGCIEPVYGGCGPMNLTRVDEDFLNTTYGVQASNQNGSVIYPGPASISQLCFQPYALPVVDTSKSSTGIEQATSFAQVQSSRHDNRLSRRNLSYIMPYRSSCNKTRQKSGIISDSGRDLPVSRGSEFQGSSAASPSERMPGDAVSLFPTTPTVETTSQAVEDQNTEQRIQVIKVVPHSPKLACESAARIFRSIQEERKQHV